MYNNREEEYFIMGITPKQLLKLLLKNGWQKENQEGSHIKLKKEGYDNIILPMHNREMAPRSIK